MRKKPKTYYIDRVGEIHIPSSSKTVAKIREQCFVIVKKHSAILCTYDISDGVYSLPQIKELKNLQQEKSLDFTVHTHVYENRRYFYDKQNFAVYNVEEAIIDGEILRWCSIDDILVKNVTFDATLYKGFKNLYVRDRNL